MLKIILIMIGGGIGAACRHGLFLLVQHSTGTNFPFGTLAVNLLGSFLIGLFWCLFESARVSPELRLFLFTGLLGGFTTFSTFSRETAQLLKVGDWKEALLYLSVSNALGLLLVFGGFLAAKQLLSYMQNT